jgi:F-type H+-transporting ATPase subunit a
MAARPLEAPYAITQFELDVLLPITLWGIDLSFTTSAQAMVTTALLAAAYLYFGIRERALIPGRLQASVEAVYLLVARTLERTAGPEATPAIPFVFTLFAYLLLGSLLGLTPVKFTFTSHAIVTLTLALAVFVYVNALGARKHGARYLRIFLPAGAPLAVAPLLVVVELLSFLFRPLTLGFRIFANILAGHMMIKLFGDFSVMLTDALGLAGLGLALMSVAMMAAMYGFEVFIICVQAYIFVLITSLYIRDALHAH